MTQACWLSTDRHQAYTEETKVDHDGKHAEDIAVEPKPVALRVESVLIHDGQPFV